MSFVIGSVIFAALMIMVSKLPVGYAMIQDGGYDNNMPREQQARLSGMGARALAAHQNSIEAFPLFAVGVLLALWGQAPVETVSLLCSVFVFARIAYVICYWKDWALPRTTVWMAGFVSSIWLMCLALP